jgi:DNA-binding NarL/FixJ family response regulator
MTKILITDDYPIIRSGLKEIISGERDMTVSGEAENAEQLFKLVNVNSYDLLLLDLGLPDMDGLQILNKLKESKINLPVLVFTVRPDYPYIASTIEAGASGFLNKMEANSELINAIRKVISGEYYMSPILLEKLVIQLINDRGLMFYGLVTKLELEIISLLVFGKNDDDIARTLKIKVDEVNNYHSNILKKLKMKSDLDLFKYCILEYFPHYVQNG